MKSYENRFFSVTSHKWLLCYVGHKQALRFVDPVRLADLEAKIKPVLYTNYKRQWGQYRILLVSPLGGRMFLWGRMCPYLSEVIVEEHCYIKGPERNSNDAVKLFAKFGTFLIILLQNLNIVHACKAVQVIH